MRKFVAVAVLGFVLVFSGCAATQKLSVTTDPSGAQVTLVRYGMTQAAGGVPGVSIGATGERFEDSPMTLGASPSDA